MIYDSFSVIKDASVYGRQPSTFYAKGAVLELRAM
jgi:hypothetical protein